MSTTPYTDDLHRRMQDYVRLPKASVAWLLMKCVRLELVNTSLRAQLGLVHVALRTKHRIWKVLDRLTGPETT